MSNGKKKRRFDTARYLLPYGTMIVMAVAAIFMMSMVSIGNLLVWISSLFTIVTFTSTLLLKTISDTTVRFGGIGTELRKVIDDHAMQLRKTVVRKVQWLIAVIFVSVFYGHILKDENAQELLAITDIGIPKVLASLLASGLVGTAVSIIINILESYRETEDDVVSLQRKIEEKLEGRR